MVSSLLANQYACLSKSEIPARTKKSWAGSLILPDSSAYSKYIKKQSRRNLVLFGPKWSDLLTGIQRYVRVMELFQVDPKRSI